MSKKEKNKNEREGDGKPNRNVPANLNGTWFLLVVSEDSVIRLSKQVIVLPCHYTTIYTTHTHILFIWAKNNSVLSIEIWTLVLVRKKKRIRIKKADNKHKKKCLISSKTNRLFVRLRHFLNEESTTATLREEKKWQRKLYKRLGIYRRLLLLLFFSRQVVPILYTTSAFCSLAKGNDWIRSYKNKIHKNDAATAMWEQRKYARILLNAIDEETAIAAAAAVDIVTDLTDQSSITQTLWFSFNSCWTVLFYLFAVVPQIKISFCSRISEWNSVCGTNARYRLARVANAHCTERDTEVAVIEMISVTGMRIIFAILCAWTLYK